MRQRRWVFPDISIDLTLPQIVNNLERIGLENALSDTSNHLKQRNQSSVEILLRSFVKNLEHFHLPGFPSIRELSDVSRNVTMKVQRGLEDNFDRLPSLEQISELSKNMTKDIHTNVKQIENGFSDFSKNITSEFQANLRNFNVPNLKDLSQFSQNVTKDLQSNLNQFSMFSKNASESLQDMAKNVSIGFEERLKHVSEMKEVKTLSEISKNITSNLGDFIFSEADKLTRYSKNVTENIILPTIEGISKLSKNFTDELGTNLNNIQLPDFTEMVRTVTNLTHLFELGKNKSQNQPIVSVSSNEVVVDNIKEEKIDLSKVMQDIVQNIISPLKNLKQLLEGFRLKSVESNFGNSIGENLIDINTNGVYSDKTEYLSPTETIVSALDTLKAVIGNIEKNQDKVALAFKVIPTLMPYILEANTPSLDIFLKEGAKFSLKDLSDIHSALINFHSFVSDTQNSLDKNKAPSFYNLTLLIKQRNLGLLNILLQLMVRADKQKDDIVIIVKEDILKIEKNIITPKEFYEVLFSSKKVKKRYYDRQFQRALV